MTFAIREDGDFEVSGGELRRLSDVEAARTVVRVALKARAPYGAGLVSIIVGSTDPPPTLMFDVTDSITSALEDARRAQERDGTPVRVAGLPTVDARVDSRNPTRIDFTVEVDLRAR